MRTLTPPSRVAAVKMLMEAHAKNEVLTGVFYIDTEKPNFAELLNLVDEPLAETLPQSRTRPSQKEVLDEMMDRLKWNSFSPQPRSHATRWAASTGCGLSLLQRTV